MVNRRAIVAALGMFSCAQAGTIHVDVTNCPGPGDGSDVDPYCSIQTAFYNAVDRDEIVVAPGTYFETFTFLGKEITLRSSGGADATAVDGTGVDNPVVRCTSGEGPGTILDGFTITHGSGVHFSPALTLGGGMYIRFSIPTVMNCTFSENGALQGGADLTP